MLVLLNLLKLHMSKVCLWFIDSILCVLVVLHSIYLKGIVAALIFNFASEQLF